MVDSRPYQQSGGGSVKLAIRAKRNGKSRGMFVPSHSKSWPTDPTEVEDTSGHKLLTSLGFSASPLWITLYTHCYILFPPNLVLGKLFLFTFSFFSNELISFKDHNVPRKHGGSSHYTLTYCLILWAYLITKSLGGISQVPSPLPVQFGSEADYQCIRACPEIIFQNWHSISKAVL